MKTFIHNSVMFFASGICLSVAVDLMTDLDFASRVAVCFLLQVSMIIIAWWNDARKRS